MKYNTNIFIMISVIALGCGQYIFTAEEAAQKQDEADRLEADRLETIFLEKLPHFRDLYYGILFPLLNMENQLDKSLFFDKNKIEGLILDINSLLKMRDEAFLGNKGELNLKELHKDAKLEKLDLAAFKSNVVDHMSREGRQALEYTTWVVKDMSSRLVKFFDRLGEYIGELNYYNAERKLKSGFDITVEVIEKMHSFVSLLETLKNLFGEKNVKVTEDSIAMYKGMVLPNLKKHLYNTYDVKKGEEEGKIVVHYRNEDGASQVETMDDPLKIIDIDFGTEGRLARARRSLQERYRIFGRYGAGRSIER